MDKAIETIWATYTAMNGMWRYYSKKEQTSTLNHSSIIKKGGKGVGERPLITFAMAILYSATLAS